MRIRSIKPEFWESESLGRVSRDARLLFIGLWTLADDSGRAREHSRYISGALFPYDEDANGKILPWLMELQKEGCIQRYEVDGNHYLVIPNFLIHQRIDKPSQSKYPPPPDGLVEPSRAFAEYSKNTPRLSRARVPSPPIPSLPEGGVGETELPTLEQAIASCMTCGIPDKFAEYVYGDWFSREGKDAGGIQVAFNRYAKKRWERERGEWTNGTHKGNRDPQKMPGRDGKIPLTASEAFSKEVDKICRDTDRILSRSSARKDSE